MDKNEPTPALFVTSWEMEKNNNNLGKNTMSYLIPLINLFTAECKKSYMQGNITFNDYIFSPLLV